MTALNQRSLSELRHAMGSTHAHDDDDALIEQSAHTSAKVEAHLRAYLVADAADLSEWNEESQTTDDGSNAPNRAHVHEQSLAMSPKHLALLQDLYLGRIAYDVLLPRAGKVLAVIGSGREAEMQIAAALAHRQFNEVRIYARQPVAAAALAKKFRHQVAKPIEVCRSPEEALHNADVVVLATGVAKPDIDADWIMRGAHISCVLPQSVTHHELPFGILSRAKIIVSDCPQHIEADPDHIMTEFKTRQKIKHLGEMVDRFNPDRSHGTTLLLFSGSDKLAAPLHQALV